MRLAGAGWGTGPLLALAALLWAAPSPAGDLEPGAAPDAGATAPLLEPGSEPDPRRSLGDEDREVVENLELLQELETMEDLELHLELSSPE